MGSLQRSVGLQTPAARSTEASNPHNTPIPSSAMDPSSPPDPIRTLAVVPPTYESPATTDPISAFAAEMAAVTDDTTRAVATDLHHAASVIRMAIPKLLPLRPELAALPRYDVTWIDRLETLAAALDAAQYACDVAERDAGPTMAALVEATRRHGRLLTTVIDGLVQSGLLPCAEPAHGTRRRSLEALAEHVGACADLLLRRQPHLIARTPLTEATLQEALHVSTVLRDRLAERARRTEARPARLVTRERLWTVAEAAWAQVQRGVRFVRFDHGDADALAPTLYATPRRARAQRVDGKPDGGSRETEAETPRVVA